MEDLARNLARHRVIPVVTIDRADDAVPLAHALEQGGLPIAEITLRTAAAEEAIARISADSKILVGAGTVLSPEQARRAADAGARFVVAPGLDLDLVAWCQDQGVAVFPGIATPTELTRAVRSGLDVVKLFPASVLGGIAMMNALAGPFPDVRFIPTGGIGPDNLASWMAQPAVLAVGGSWMAPARLIRERRFAEITTLVAAAVAARARGAV